MSDQSVPASWIPAGWTALVFGAIALLLGGLSAREAGVGVVIIQLPMVPALIIFALASAIAVVLIWAKPRTDVTRLSRALAAGLTLEWVGVAAFGTYGPSVGFSYGLTSRLLTQCGVAMSLLLLVTIRSRVAPARPPRARR